MPPDGARYHRPMRGTLPGALGEEGQKPVPARADAHGLRFHVAAGRFGINPNTATSIAMTASRFSSNMCPHGEGQNVRGEPRIRDRALRSR
jgi:hypothetical protein